MDGDPDMARSDPGLVESDFDHNTNEGQQQPVAGGARRKKKVATTAKVCGIELQYYMLACICFLTFGSYWVFDTPGAIFTQLQEWFESGGDTYTNADGAWLYSIYSWPNTVLAFFGGFIVDKLTVRVGATLFCGLVMLGETIFCLGVQYKNYWICFVGRLVFGLGGESLTVAQNTFTVRWFDGPMLALAFGLVLAFARIGSSVNFVVTPILADDVPFSVWFGCGMCGISMIMCLLGCMVDLYGERKRNEEKLMEQQQVMAAGADSSVQAADEVEEVEELPSMGFIRYFPISAWLLFLICLFFYIGVLVFYQVASDIMQHSGKHTYSAETASLYISIPNFVSIGASPFFGRVVDRKGRALYCILIASSALTLGHLGFLARGMEWLEINPIPLMIWIGICYSLGAASIWPILSVIIDRKMLGTAYGCMTAVQNAGLAVFPLLIGELQDAPGIKDNSWKYTLPIIIFVACEGVAFLLTLVLVGVDKRIHAGRMNMSGVEREEYNRVHGELYKPLVNTADEYPSADAPSAPTMS